MSMEQDDERQFEDLLDRLREDPEARRVAIKVLARDFSSEFLQPVRIDTEALQDVSARFLASDKEWQE